MLQLLRFMPIIVGGAISYMLYTREDLPLITPENKVEEKIIKPKEKVKNGTKRGRKNQKSTAGIESGTTNEPTGNSDAA